MRERQGDYHYLPSGLDVTSLPTNATLPVAPLMAHLYTAATGTESRRRQLARAIELFVYSESCAHALCARTHTACMWLSLRVSTCYPMSTLRPRPLCPCDADARKKSQGPALADEKLQFSADHFKQQLYSLKTLLADHYQGLKIRDPSLPPPPDLDFLNKHSHTWGSIWRVIDGCDKEGRRTQQVGRTSTLSIITFSSACSCVQATLTPSPTCPLAATSLIAATCLLVPAD